MERNQERKRKIVRAAHPMQSNNNDAIFIMVVPLYLVRRLQSQDVENAPVAGAHL